jgi:hypothetical protein
MTVYKSDIGGIKSITEKHEVNSYIDEMNDDDTVRILDHQQQYHQRGAQLIRCSVILISLIVIILCGFAAAYLYMHKNTEKYKPWIETCRVHYHEWKTGANGKDQSFLMEGEFYQQVEIDVTLEKYEKLNVPSVLNSRRAIILHDMEKGLTVIVDQDHGRCFIMQINATLVKPISDFYNLVQNNKAGYYLPDAILLHDSYRLQKPAIDDVSQFGRRIAAECQYYDTYRLTRDDNSVDESVETPCYFKGERYCTGNSGSKYMLLFEISRCVG